MGPAVIEDIFALAVPFYIHGGDALDLAVQFKGEMIGHPAAIGADGAAVFQRLQELMSDKGMIARKTGIPVGLTHLGNGLKGSNQGGVRHPVRKTQKNSWKP